MFLFFIAIILTTWARIMSPLKKKLGDLGRKCKWKQMPLVESELQPCYPQGFWVLSVILFQMLLIAKDKKNCSIHANEQLGI